jgi:hypothetical protein
MPEKRSIPDYRVDAFITLSSAPGIPISNSKIMAAVCMFFV